MFSKQSPINGDQIPQTYLDMALYKVESTVKHFYDVKMKLVAPIGCGKCSTCIEKRKETPIISLADIVGVM